MDALWDTKIRERLGASKWLTDEESRDRLSKDYYWYSPILSEKLKEKVADGVARPETEEEVAWLLAFAYEHHIPITPRGTGTGNYGQSIPLHGGIVLDLSRMNQIVEIGDGYARVKPGVKLGVLEKKAWESNQELRIYPSTFMTATVGGYISGGSAGIGSIEWGTLWDGNVVEAVIYTMEAQPRRLVITGESLIHYIHSYGTTGILVEAVVALAPRTQWMQSIANFATFEQAACFAEALSLTTTFKKRLISPAEWPLPSFFTPLAKVIESEMSCVLLETADGSLPALTALVESYGGQMGHVIPAASYRKGVGLSDFTYNHTTLWALKADPAYTYVQAQFSLDAYVEQIRLIKAKFGDEVLLHMEWLKAGGKLVPAGIPVIRFTTEERLYEIFTTLRAFGLSVSNTHIWTLENGSGNSLEPFLTKKDVNDPYNLLNPGKIKIED